MVTLELKVYDILKHKMGKRRTAAIIEYFSPYRKMIYRQLKEQS